MAIAAGFAAASLCPVTPAELEARIRSRWDFNDPVASYELMSHEAAKAQEPERSIWLTQAARALGLQDRLREAAQLLVGLDPSRSHHVQARWAIETGRVCNSEGDPAQARPFFELALAEAESAGAEGLAIDAIHMLGIAASSDEEAVRWNEVGLARAEASLDPQARRWKGSLLNNLGWAHLQAGRFAEAVECFEAALAEREAEGDPMRIAHAHEALAEARRSLSGP